MLEPNYNLKLDISLVIHDLKRKLGRRAKILDDYLNGYKISEICKRHKLSRFIVTNTIKGCLEYARKILEEEGVYYARKKKKNRRLQKKTRG